MPTFIDVPHGRKERRRLNLDHVVSVEASDGTTVVKVVNGNPIYVYMPYGEFTALMDAALLATGPAAPIQVVGTQADPLPH